jgi:hypothetical protein
MGIKVVTVLSSLFKVGCSMFDFLSVLELPVLGLASGLFLRACNYRSHKPVLAD